MWFGHILFPILIHLLTNKALDLYALVFGSCLPNLDAILGSLGLASKDFHMGIFHTPFFVVLASVMVFSYDLVLGLCFLIGGLSHILADTGCDTGIMWFYPVSRRRFAFCLWVNTGMNSERREYKGVLEDCKGYYRQKVPMASELLLLVTVILLVFLK